MDHSLEQDSLIATDASDVGIQTANTNRGMRRMALLAATFTALICGAAIAVGYASHLVDATPLKSETTDKDSLKTSEQLYENYFGHRYTDQCNCDCSWAGQAGACDHIDGQECWSCCCARHGYDTTAGYDRREYDDSDYARRYDDSPTYYDDDTQVRHHHHYHHDHYQYSDDRNDYDYHPQLTEDRVAYQLGSRDYRQDRHEPLRGFYVGETAYIEGRRGGWWPATVLDRQGDGVYHVKYHLDHRDGGTYLVHAYRMRHNNPQVFSPLIWAGIVLGCILLLSICICCCNMDKKDQDRLRDRVLLK